MLDYRMYRILTTDFTYDEFRSEIYHFLKHNPVRNYIEQLLKYTIIDTLYKREEYDKAFFLLALFNYYCDKYNVINTEFFLEYENMKLEELRYPDNVIKIDMINKNDVEKELLLKKCKTSKFSSFFLKYNIAEYQENVDEL